MKRYYEIFRAYPYLFLSLPLSLIWLVIILLIRPFIQTRIYLIRSNRIGHFAADIELHICEKKEQHRKELSLFYFARPACNKQLAKMWRRKIIIFPPFFLRPLDYLIRNIGFLHSFVGTTMNFDRDILNLYDKYPAQISFTASELIRGEKELQELGIPRGNPFVCMIVRDGKYLSTECSTDFKNDYRNSNIQNYILAAEELTLQEYYVIRMGAKVEEAIQSLDSKIIDYASNGMRSDFMDIYLGAKCHFCISVGTGFDAIPQIFRRPVVYVNMVPIGVIATYRSQYLVITKHYYSIDENRELTLKEIISCGAFLNNTSDYELNRIQLIENTPEEIRDVVIEMVMRLDGSWKPGEDDEKLQHRFWEIFPSKAVASYNGRPLHGEIRSRFGAQFLRNNSEWLM